MNQQGVQSSEHCLSTFYAIHISGIFDKQYCAAPTCDFGRCMILSPNAARARMAIDNRVNRDLIGQAREQGFVFSDPPADFSIWQQVATADLENPAYDCCPIVSEWLFGKAIEATLFQIYQQQRRQARHPLSA